MKKGFTLIELLVVMVIIAILSGISIFGVDNARKSARDSRRKGDLETIRSALELYKADCGVYPPAPLGSTITGSAASCIPNGVVYLQTVPTDPKDPFPAYLYTPNAAHTTYTINATLESTATPYQVTNP